MSTSLMPGERPLSLARQHWSVLGTVLVLGLIGVVGGIVILVAVPSTITGRNFNSVKAIIVLVIELLAIGWMGINVLRWRLKTYLLTDRRVIVESGVLSRLTESIPLDRIQNTVIRRPLGDRVIGAGNIEIESAGRDGVEILHRVPKAETFYNELLQAIDATRLGPSGPPPRPVGGV
jgi:uncharacterized membrane protein YdbT with pleckstrin-like domain